MNSSKQNQVFATGQAQGLIEEGEAFRKLSGMPSVESAAPRRERFDVVVIGGGQAGLSVGYHLKQQGLSFLILDGSARIGDAWRKRWDTLRLFTPARYDGLDGMPFPGDPDAFPTKDQMADYLESYAAHFQLPVRTGVRVERLWREGDRYRIKAGALEIEASQVVIAMASYQGKKMPAFAKALAPDVVQLHSSEYKNLAQLKPGGVLVVGAGNSGAEIAMETATRHPTWVAGRDLGQVPFDIAGFWGRLLLARILFRIVFHRILTVRTPMGRKARPKMIKQRTPLIRHKNEHLLAAGVERVAKVEGVKGGLPVLADGRVLPVNNVIWATGFDLGLSWIDLPIFEPDGEPRHQSGVVEGQPGLYFVGQHFLHAMSSSMVHGVGRDAERIAAVVAAHGAAPASSPSARRASEDAQPAAAGSM